MSSYRYPQLRELTRRGRRVACLVPMLLGLAVLFLPAIRPAVALTHQPAPPLVSRVIQVNTLPGVHSQAMKLIGHLGGGLPMRLTITLRMRNEAELQQLTTRFQDPRSPLFHHFLTMQQWKDRFAPLDTTVQAVVVWATTQGFKLTHRFASNLALVVDGKVKTVNRAFSITENEYTIHGRRFYANDRDPTLPKTLAGTVRDVLGLSSYAQVQAANGEKPGPDDGLPHVLAGPFITMRNLRANGSMHPHFSRRRRLNALRPKVCCLSLFDLEPPDIMSPQAYNFKALQALGHCCNPTGNPNGTPPQQSIAIVGNNAPADSDLMGFYKEYGLAANITEDQISGPACCDVEMTLDMEWSGAMANSFGSYKQTAHLLSYESGETDLGGLYDAWQAAFSDNQARNLSTSAGSYEDSYGGLSTPTISSFVDLTNAMVSLGWSLVAATGDHGAYADCSNVSVMYPATDPNVVAVGGTNLVLPNNNGTYAGETTWSGGGCDGHEPADPNSNGGGGGGGCSNSFFAPMWQSGAACPSGRRAVPDISLNADPTQVIYYNGGNTTSGGTSIAAPEMAGFFAQENAYLGSLGNICGASSNAPCAPMGNPAPALYFAGYDGTPHNPYYDIQTGCNGGGVSQGYCAKKGFDLATGWGSANMLQLAWAINYYVMGGGHGNFDHAPTIAFNAPPTNHWYNKDQIINFAISPANAGLAGFTAQWDVDPGDPRGEATPGQGNPFWDGPAVHNGQTSGSLALSAVGQGCHTAWVRAWDNLSVSGLGSVGPLCYDTIPPVTTVSDQSVNGWLTDSEVLLAATDGGSGVAATYYFLDPSPLCRYACSFSTYGAPLLLADGRHTLYYYSVDNAGNVEPVKTIALNVDRIPPTTTATLSGNKMANGAYLGTVQITLQASDNLSGVQMTHYEVDGGAVQTYAGPFTVAGLRGHTVSYWSTDNASNLEKPKWATFTILAGPPVVTPQPTVVPGAPRAWGANATGALGNGTTTDSASPVAVNHLSEVVSMAGGPDFSLALKSDGTVWAWGDDRSAQLAFYPAVVTKTYILSSTTPMQVGTLNGIIAIAAANGFGLALKSDGTVWAWGTNRDGELGRGYTGLPKGCICSPQPQQVVNIAGAVAIAAGGEQSMALTSDGTVWVWGAASATPAPMNGVSKVVAIAAGLYYSLALKSDGTVWAWGKNRDGELGNGTTTSSASPVQVSGLTDVVAIAAGAYHSLALKSDSTVWTWGFNRWGQLGNGTTTDSNVPVHVFGLSKAVAIAAGGDHSLALASGGVLQAWGGNANGQLGTGSMSTNGCTCIATPGAVGGLNRVEAMTGGGAHSLAIVATAPAGNGG